MFFPTSYHSTIAPCLSPLDEVLDRPHRLHLSYRRATSIWPCHGWSQRTQGVLFIRYLTEFFDDAIKDFLLKSVKNFRNTTQLIVITVSNCFGVLRYFNVAIFLSRLLDYNYVRPLLCRSQWPRGLRRRSTAARLLRLWVRISPGAWMSVCCECCVLSGRGLYDALITRPEESYRLWSVVVCDLQA